MKDTMVRVNPKTIGTVDIDVSTPMTVPLE